MNITFSTDTEGTLFLVCHNLITHAVCDVGVNVIVSEWDLLNSLMKLADVQSQSLAGLKPTISYIVNNNR